jgi:spore coat protein U-like protein
MRSRVIARNSLALLLIGIPLASTDALAGSRSTGVVVSLVLQNDCMITASNLDFGATGMLSSNVDADTSVSVTCTPGTQYSIGLDAGTPLSSTVNKRLLANSTSSRDTIAYQLYQDSAHQTIWGNSTAGQLVSGTGDGVSHALKVYGRVPVPEQSPAAGTYTSTITATINF